VIKEVRFGQRWLILGLSSQNTRKSDPGKSTSVAISKNKTTHLVYISIDIKRQFFIKLVDNQITQLCSEFAQDILNNLNNCYEEPHIYLNIIEDINRILKNIPLKIALISLTNYRRVIGINSVYGKNRKSVWYQTWYTRHVNN